MKSYLALFAAVVMVNGCGTSPVLTDGKAKSVPTPDNRSTQETNDPGTITCNGMMFRLEEDHEACDEDSIGRTLDSENKGGDKQDKENTPVSQPEPTKPTGPDTRPPATPTPAPQKPPVDQASLVIFEIKDGTGKNPWNTADAMVIAKKGQIIRIVNKDKITHRLHTNGAPCGHGPDILAGKSFDCVATKTFNANDQGNIYDHIAGTSAIFYVRVDP